MEFFETRAAIQQEQPLLTDLGGILTSSGGLQVQQSQFENSGFAGLRLQTFIVVDCRRGLQDMDMHLLDMLAEYDLDRTVVLTKADKLKQRAVDAVVHTTAMTLASFGHLDLPPDAYPVPDGSEFGTGDGLICTSSKSNLGIAQLRTVAFD